MGAWGALIMGFFGAVFAAMTMARQPDFTGAWPMLPFAGFALIAIAAVQVIRMPGKGAEFSARAQRVTMWSSIAEGIGIFVAANIVVNLNRPDLLLPAIALIVGLHFLPIAVAAGFRPFHALGGALIVAAAAGFGVGGATGAMLAGTAAAGALWIAALAAIARERAAKRAGQAG